MEDEEVKRMNRGELDEEELDEEEVEEEEVEEELEKYPQNHPVQHSRQYDWGQNAVSRFSYKDDILLDILLPCDQDS